MKEERALILAGCLGLATVAFVACSDDTSSAGTTTDTDAGTSTTDGGTTSDDGSTTATDGGKTVLTCTPSASTAANTAAVAAAAQGLVGKLTTAQTSTIQLTNTLANVEQWSNLPTTFIPRNGVMIGDMTTDAQSAAVALVTAATSANGLTLFSELRAADEFLVTDGHAAATDYGAGRYYVSFYGTPSASTPWTLQIAGHHLAYNFTYNGACTSATPLFEGVEPTTWTDPNDASMHAPLESNRAASVAVIRAISSNAASKLSGSFSDVVNGPTNQNGKGDTRYPSGLTYPTGTTGRGVLVGSLDAATQALVKTAIEAWVGNAADPVATALLADYEGAALAETYVAYSGATDLTTQLSYFRIDGPRVWIEVTIQGGIVYHDRVHYHTIWRDKQSDYGAEYVDSTAIANASDGGMGGGGPPGDGGGPPDGGPGGGM